MSEEKLTVAELMARAANEGRTTDAPRRRRRRSIEDGGVSVAELTGSIPAVKEKPAESRHSSVPIDAPAEKPAEKSGETKAAETKAVETAQPAAPVEKPAEKAAGKATEAPKVGEKPAEVKKPEAKKPEVKPQAPAAKQEEKPADKASSTSPETDSAGRPAPSNEETMVLRIVDEKDPISLTTGAFPVVPASAAKPAPTVRAAKDADAETALKADFAEEKAVPASKAQPFETSQIPAVTDSHGAARVAAGVADDAAADTTSERVDAVADAEEESDSKMSVFSIILMAVVGIVLGVVVFMCFEMLWERLNTWIVAILAVGVTLGMVGIVHALRTSRDAFSMVLAGIVGIVMTFGPLAIVM
ncbi:membrane protein [Corynebacterium deserti GIMN1.010]|uniref:Membrane protein n=1 Tax=Corynebacterium deserti GIMN1.010 TaxID=931089 RepID=A0A0M3Q931_9CORY|nr:hypothetical protein [Corynebacterium deserti]ALC04913.1 membrane protein [Corynebacterium deserti GIMN1.010]